MPAKKTATGEFRFVASPIHLKPSQSISLFPSRLRFLMNTESDLECKRGNRLHQKRSNLRVETVSGNSLTVAFVNPVDFAWTLADIVGRKSGFPLPIDGFFYTWDEAYLTVHRRKPWIRRARSKRSAARKQLLPLANVARASSSARSVELRGISHCRHFLSRNETLYSPPYSLRPRDSNS